MSCRPVFFLSHAGETMCHLRHSVPLTTSHIRMKDGAEAWGNRESGVEIHHTIVALSVVLQVPMLLARCLLSHCMACLRHHLCCNAITLIAFQSHKDSGVGLFGLGIRHQLHSPDDSFAAIFSVGKLLGVGSGFPYWGKYEPSKCISHRTMKKINENGLSIGAKDCDERPVKPLFQMPASCGGRVGVVGGVFRQDRGYKQ